LFTTLIRFDPVYVGHFKSNIRRIADYPRISDYMRTLFRIEGVAATFDLEHIKRLYYQSDRKLKPSSIVSVGPEFSFMSRASAEMSQRRL
jgi:glutathionyl-hydroquinone reductase